MIARRESTINDYPWPLDQAFSISEYIIPSYMEIIADLERLSLYHLIYIFKPRLLNVLITGKTIVKNWLFWCLAGFVRFARHCGEMYSRHLFSYAGFQIKLKLAFVVRVLQNTENLVISRCRCAENGKEMYKVLQRKCTVLVNLLFSNTKLKQIVTTTSTRTSPKNRFNEQTNSCVRA